MGDGRSGARRLWDVAVGALVLVRRVVVMLPLGLVLGIVAMDWVTFVFGFQRLRFDAHPIATVAWVAAFTTCATLTVVSYLRCVFTSNAVRDHPPPAHFDGDDCPRCAKCNGLKPNRTHHCSMCGHCCLKMDHHCPWIANCVGHYNQKYFILFLMWACLGTACPGLVRSARSFAHSLGCIVYIAGVGTDALKVFEVRQKESFAFDVMSLFAVLSSVAFAISLLGFVSFHLHLVLSNQTTLEFGFIRRGENVFDLGRRRNFESVFGSRRLLWLLPVNTLKVSGWDYQFRAEESYPISPDDCDNV